MTLSVVVTGASGFLGNALVERLKGAPDVKVIPVSRSASDSPCFCVDNYRDTPGGDVLVHTAEDSNRGRVNALGAPYRKQAGELLDVLLAKDFKKVIYCSSGAVYGDTGNRPFSEETVVKSTDNYVRSKLENESRVLSVKGIVVRLSNIVGSGMSSDNVFSDILKQLSGSEPLVVRNDRPICDFVWLEDVVNAIQILITQGRSGIYNIGTGFGTSIREIAEMALSISGQDSRIVESMAPSSRSSYNVLDFSKMKNMYGWVPQKSVYESIKELIKTCNYIC